MIDSVSSLIKHTSVMNFLLIDDDKEFQKNLFNLLENFSSNISIASDGKEALEKYQSSPTKFDILFVDINLPKLNGLDLIHQIRNINPKQAICVVSAYSETDVFIKCIHLGINEYLIKPLSFNEFVNMMNSMVSNLVYDKNINLTLKNDRKILTSGYKANKK